MVLRRAGTHQSMRRFALGLLWPTTVFASALGAAPARAEPLAPASADVWRVHSDGRLTVDGGLVLGLPVALGTGLATGVGGGAMIGAGRVFSWGIRASWATATESSIAWTVTHADLRLRAAAGVDHTAGRGRFGLRLGVGPSLLHESRLRNQGSRAGLTGSDLETSTFTLIPTADLEAVVALHILGPWLLVVSGGPSLAMVDGGVKGGFTAQVGVGWQP
jgi:hypothetical protein